MNIFKAEVPIPKLLSKRFLRFYTANGSVLIGITSTITVGSLPHLKCKIFKGR